jgi:site-specific DNA-methyltransferase (adenine-specific)
VTDSARLRLVSTELARCEAVIARGLDTFVEVGEALSAIRDQHLYRERGFRSFEAYLKEQWSMGRNTGYTYIQAAEVARNVPTSVQLPSVSHAALLHSLPRDEQIALAEQVAVEHGSIKWLRRVIAQKQSRAREEASEEYRRAGQPPEVAHAATWRIELGDARQLELADGEAHLVVTSPPYNARVKYANYVDWLPWEDYWQGLIEPALREAYRVLCPGGRLCLNLPNVVRQDVSRTAEYRHEGLTYGNNGGRKWSPAGANGRVWSALVEAHLYPLAAAIGFLPRERIQWLKGDDPDEVTTPSTAWGTWLSAKNPVLRAVGEPIYVFSKSSYDRPDDGESDLSVDDFKRDTRNVWFVRTAGRVAGEFPAFFPLELPRRLIRLYSYRGDLVVDPFVGSGTTIMAAVECGRRGYGVDVDPAAVSLANVNVSRLDYKSDTA